MTEPGSLIPLTHAEKRVYFTQKMYPESSMWNLSNSFRIADADPELLARAVEFVFKNTPGLQVRFTEQDGMAQKYLSPESEPEIEHLDFRESGEDAYIAWAEQQAKLQVPMLDSPPYQVAVADAGNKIAFVFAKFHHIALDGGACNLVHRRVLDAYQALAAGEQPELSRDPDVALAFESEQEYLGSEQFEGDREYWNSVFQNLPEPLHISHRGPTDCLYLDSVKHQLSTRTRKALLEFCSTHKVSPFRVVLAALAIVLSRTLRREDLVLGTATGNRHPGELQNAAGMFVSTLALRMQVQPDSGFQDMVDLARDTMRSAVEHERYPYDLLTDDLRRRTGETRDLIGCSLVEVVQAPLPENAKYMIHNQGESLNSLAFFFSYPHRGMPANTPLEFMVTYNRDLYPKWQIEQILGHLENAIYRGIQDPKTPVFKMDFLDKQEHRRILEDFNQSTADWDPETTLQECVRAASKDFPGHRAVVYRGSSLTYAELESRANALARKLREYGAKPEAVVGVLADRSLEIIVCQLAILKSGAAFMPIDAEYPQSRIKFMLGDINAPIIVTQTRFIQELDFGGATVFNMDDSGVFSGDPSPVDNVNSPGDLCTVIYTSGSTGNPKGVLLEHRSICNILQATRRDQDITPRDRISKHASFSFDAGIQEVFLALISGAELHVIPEEIRLSLSHLNEYYESNKITWAFLTTQLGEQFMEFMDNFSLRYLQVGGEKLRTFRPRNYRLKNGYGPSECSALRRQFRDAQYRDGDQLSSRRCKG